ncbi:MAG: glycosyltransferase family 2 protein [Erysipelotrichaceae bacterium]|jgi:glycosyltransferase involved in cell wall biosynthesis|nr:glycosyltransferase family 2 protein [Erysipelotrichaceae bacterium]
MLQLSICIPSYNTTAFIDKCLPSYVDKRIFHLVEIFLVNDGSTDPTTLIKLQEYETKYPFLFKIINKENGGHGSCINITIPLAKGRYYKVIDGDDYVDTEAFVAFVHHLKNINTDIVTHSYTNIYTDQAPINTSALKKPTKNEVMHSLETVILNYQFLSLATLTFKTKLLQEIHLTVLEKTFYEDAEYSLYPLASATSITHFDLFLYQYYQGSGLNQSTNINSLKNRINEQIKVFFKLLDFYETKTASLSPNIKSFILKEVRKSFKVILRIFLKFTRKDWKARELKAFINQIKAKSLNFYHIISRDKILKIARLLNYFGYQLLLPFTYKKALRPLFKYQSKK